MTGGAAYPAEWESDVVLSDGRTAHLRPIRPSDADGLYSLWEHLSSQSIYLRFFAPVPRPSRRQLQMLATVDYVDRMALVAQLGSEILGVARYDRRVNVTDAEVAFVVADEHQGRGIGTALLEQLAAVGRANGIHRFVAETLPENHRMLAVFRAAGWSVDSEFGDGVIEVSFPIESTEQSRAVLAAREQSAGAESVLRFLSPSSVAVVTADAQEGNTFGTVVRRRLRSSGFRGPVYDVRRRGGPRQAGTYRTLLDIPATVDLVVVDVPPRLLRPVLENCARIGIGAVVVAGSDPPGAGPGAGSGAGDLVAFARQNGMRLVGPDAGGLLNTDPAVRLNASSRRVLPPRGGVSVATQLGEPAATELEEKHSGALDVATWVSLGTRSDVSVNDLLRYWEDDGDTTVVALAVASFGNPFHFVRLVRSVSRRKPVVAAYPTRGPDDDTLLAQLGVIRVDDADELVEATRLCLGGVDADAPADSPVARRVSAHALWARRNEGSPASFDDIDATVIEDVAESFLDRNDGAGALSPEQAMLVCRSAGIPTQPTRRVATADEAASAATEIGFPVAVKVASESVDYRDHTGGLHLGLNNEDDVRQAFTALTAALGDDTGGALIQPMAAAGVPVALTVAHDARFGSVAFVFPGPDGRFGSGPRAVHVLPVTDVEAREFVRTAFSTLFPADVTPPWAEGRVADTLLRLSQITGDVPELTEIALDPLVVTPEGPLALDVYARVSPAPTGPPADLRRMA
ncbi:MAG: GNAT family N-acetyltransferase [Acidimicrobiia bacterium]